ncbi:MAG: bifunctional adenosylcobinamide kinase/adenosylcobinamide-phosphate guanylyltransferase [Fastidiosipilaceae bacterium]|jgi:adenosylcobinamide kinase/adenosylcobinamide-phosphate guanylyltransferase
MILVIGSLASGKTEYVKTLGYSDSDIADGVLDGRPVLDNLQDLIFADPAGADRLFSLLTNKEVVICAEVGSGVIPIESGAREAREAVGRLCIRLANEAERVVRLVCGIPTLIKGDR